jgi:hypothetical protein
MATIGKRAATWSNSDGLVVGFGPNSPAIAGANAKNYGGIGGSKTAVQKFDWKNLNAADALKITVPAGTRVLDVRLVVDTGFTSTGTNTISVGDATTAAGFITTSAATTTTMASAGAVINCDGVYAFGATDTVAAELKVYSSATDIVLATAQTDWTAGSATMVVTYL